MEFYTDPRGIECDYALVKIQDYLKHKDKLHHKKILIDPGVYDLTPANQEKKNLHGEYSFEKDFDVKAFLNSLPENHYFSLDYPSDMNLELTDLFLQKTWDNALKYHSHKNYIVTVQSKFLNYMSFKEWFDKYNQLNIKSGILGLGNLCRIFNPTEFVKTVLGYAFSHCNASINSIHIYGLAMANIPYAYKMSRKFKINLSIDSTKWTRAVNELLKACHGVNCRARSRQLFFEMYKETIMSRNIKLANTIKWLDK